MRSSACRSGRANGARRGAIAPARRLLRDALAQYFGGRYTRAQKSAQRAPRDPGRDARSWRRTTSSPCLGHLLAAGSAHRVQNRALRDEELRRALDLVAAAARRRASAEEGARLLAAEWALDDRDAPRAIELLNALPLGVARRTHALRLKLQAARLGRLAAGGAEDGAAADQAPGLLGGRRAPAWSARSPSSRSTRVTTLDQLRRLWLLVRSGRPARSVHRRCARGAQAGALGANRRCARLAAAALGS